MASCLVKTVFRINVDEAYLKVKFVSFQLSAGIALIKNSVQPNICLVL